MTVHIPFDNSYARLGAPFVARLDLSPVAAPRLIGINEGLARELGLDPATLTTPEAVAFFAGSRVLEGAEPIAAAYAGHQFGGFNPQLGDGRAMLLGEIVDIHGARRDIQLKGSGRTPFSRGGDGRAALGPVLREYIVSEAMAALGIPTTRALAAVTTGEKVYREIPLPGAVLTRVASSHIRFGTFQFFAARGDTDSLRRLTDHVIARHYPEVAAAANPPLSLLEAVIARHARLVARWMGLGFIHGVMNTDNASIAGETIDYGPCAFMDTYDPKTVYSSIDAQGRYAYANQPGITQWNLVRLAECLIALIDDDEAKAIEQAQAALTNFAALYQAAMLDVARAKLGLATARNDDFALWTDLLELMATAEVDFTVTFRLLCGAMQETEAVRESFVDLDAFDAWAMRWHARLAEEPAHAEGRAERMHRANPAFIPRNHRVEEVIEAAVERGDFAPFELLGKILARPFENQPDFEAFAQPPAERTPYRTFCGT